MRAVFRYCNRKGEVSILFCGDTAIRTYNRIFLKRNRATDVIAFYDNKNLPGFQKDYLGDIAISVDRAKSQAKQMGHPVKKELSILVIHGILHLLGYEDTTSTGKKRMFNKQDEIYKAITKRFVR